MFKDCLEEDRYVLSVQGLARMQSSDFAVLVGLASNRLKPCSAYHETYLCLLAAQTAMPPSQ